MILIIGGAYQGKEEYAMENYKNVEIIRDFHLFVLDLIKDNINPLEYVKKNLSFYKDKVIICEDISQGIVPVDTTMRLWREELGRAMTFLSNESDEIIRMFCGIGSKIK